MNPQDSLNAIAVAKATATGFAWLGAGLGCGVTVIGVGSGIGRLAASALEAGARQPEAAGDIRATMIIGAALIEGVALFAMVVCVLLAIK